MPKQRVHNEWFQPVQKQAYGGGSRCPCGCSKKDRIKAGQDPQMYAWGEYVHAKWRTIKYFCHSCYNKEVLEQLAMHANGCGCIFQLNPRSGHGPLPTWLQLTDQICKAA
jgi:hypothetical protein